MGTKFKQTPEGRRKDKYHYFYRLAGVIVLAFIIFWRGVVEEYDPEQPLFRYIVFVLGGIVLMLGLKTVGGQYLLFRKYSSKEDYVEVCGDNLLTRVVKLGEGSCLSLESLKRFTYSKRRKRAELVPKNGEKLILENYENQEELVAELRKTSAGKVYRESFY